MWLKNSSGKPDAILTFLTFFVGVLLWRYAVGGMTVPLLGPVPAFESGAAIAILGTLLPAYLARRNGWGNRDAASTNGDHTIVE
ncbi:MAG: hypothetical protein ACE5EX_01810 [Phycisphaerae bacterium]